MLQGILILHADTASYATSMAAIMALNGMFWKLTSEANMYSTLGKIGRIGLHGQISHKQAGSGVPSIHP